MNPKILAFFSIVIFIFLFHPSNLAAGGKSCVVTTCGLEEVFDLKTCICIPRPYCGDGFVNGGEECDETADPKKGRCAFGTCGRPGEFRECVCIAPRCGDSEVNQEGEECDAEHTEACAARAGLNTYCNMWNCKCAYAASCPDKECPSPLVLDSKICKCISPQCGNGKLDPTEQCEYGELEGCDPIPDGKKAWCDPYTCQCTYH